jgi:aldose 1-epimerase
MGRLGMEEDIAVGSIGKSYSEVCIDKEIAIEIFTLENKNGTKLLISNFGATAISLFVKDKNGFFSDIILGYENQSDYFNDKFYFGSVVGRYANRIAGDTVVIDDIAYKISTTDGVYHLHGGTLGFNKKVFTALPFCTDNSVGLSLKYVSPHLEEGFPGELTLEVLYSLDDDDNWTVEYKATSDRTTILNLTQHTYFNLSGNFNTIIDNHVLKINSHFFLPVNKAQVPIGNFENVVNSPFDFTALKIIGKDIQNNNNQLEIGNGYDHTWILEKDITPLLKNAATLIEPISGRRLDVFTTEPSIHLYTGNFLENVIGKSGVVYGKRSGLCLETQHFPDSPNNNNFPTTILQPGEEFYSKTVFKFSVV